MSTTAGVLVYLIGLDPLMTAAINADLPGTRVASFPSLRAALSRHAVARPDLVLLYLSRSAAPATVARLRAAWGDQVVVVGLDRRTPRAQVWAAAGPAVMVELGPDFLEPFLPAQRTEFPPSAHNSKHD